MLRYIAIVTLFVQQIGPVETAYREHLGYSSVHGGKVSTEQAALWAAPGMAGKEFTILAPASGRPVYLRIIGGADAPVAAPGKTWGWNALELLTTDPDALQARLEGAPYTIIGPPRDLWPAPNAPRAMQALGPAGELLYFTRVIPSGFEKPMAPAVTPVDRVFIMVVGGPSMAALTDFYGKKLGLAVSKPQPFQITTLSRSLGLPLDTKYPLATAALPKDFLVEMDEYPGVSVPRPTQAGSLPPGIAMVSFGVTGLDDLPLELDAPGVRLAEFPYNGQQAAVVRGPAGEWIELVEIAGLSNVTPGIPLP